MKVKFWPAEKEKAAFGEEENTQSEGEVKKAMSENRKGENNSFFGKTQSEETKAKLREIALNRNKLHKPGIKVKVLDLETNEIIIYDSIREAVKSLNTHLSTLFRREEKNITAQAPI